jgi:lipopolysaccharide export system permease protein
MALRVNTLHRYLLRQVIATLLMTAAVFTFVLLLGNVLREILPLLMNQKATLGIVAEAFGLLIPFVLVFALPMGMLTATLLVMGRFSADQELTAARASGFCLLSMITPILILSVVLCGVSAAVNLDIAPRSRVAYNNLRFDLKAALATAQLPEGRPIMDFPGYILYVGKEHKNDLQDVLIYKLKDETNLEFTVRAPRGRLERDAAKGQFVFHLFNATYVDVASATPATSSEFTYTLPFEISEKSSGKPSLSNMTFAELKQELRDVEKKIALPLPVEKNPRAVSSELRKKEKKVVRKQLSNITEPIRVQIHRRMAFSFACFGFTLIGIPLGIRMHRRETNVGVAIALLLVAVYYGLLVVAESLSTRPEFAPHLLVWIPNFVFEAAGAVLLWRANRGI